MEEENEIIRLRKEKLQWLINQNINPYPHSFNKKDNSLHLQKKFSILKKGTKTKTNVSIAGRIMTSRIMGNASFFTIQDESGRIQIFATKDTLKNYDIVKKLDNGDIIGVNGFIFKTKAGELTVHAKEFILLAKSLKPLAAKWHGLKDPELRYRQRYLDLISNPSIKEVFIKRNQVINAMREFLVSKGFIEVDTPILQPIYGGTNARPFKTFLYDLKMNVYLRISNELYLKRLIVGGFEKIFEFSKDFRNEGIDRTHNPEFLQIETMWAYADYKKNMDLCEEMIEYIAKRVLGKTKFEYQGTIIDVKRPWKRMSMVQSIKHFTKIDIEKMSDDQLKKFLVNNKIELKRDFSRGVATDLIFQELVESKLIQPTLIYDFPHETCVLAKQKKENPRFAERFEPFINGWEIGNSYSEENRPEILKKEWEKEEKKHLKGDEEAQRMDLDFITALEIGMPPTSGLGIGIDRLVMLLTNQPSIRDVILFPFMRQENK